MLQKSPSGHLSGNRLPAGGNVVSFHVLTIDLPALNMVKYGVYITVNYDY
jgi:hypothetical protein